MTLGKITLLILLLGLLLPDASLSEKVTVVGLEIDDTEQEFWFRELQQSIPGDVRSGGGDVGGGDTGVDGDITGDTGVDGDTTGDTGGGGDITVDGDTGDATKSKKSKRKKKKLSKKRRKRRGKKRAKRGKGRGKKRGKGRGRKAEEVLTEEVEMINTIGASSETQSMLRGGR